MSDEAPERIWIWGWRTDSVWQEQTWQHEDEPMSTMEYVRFDLIETAEQRGYANAMEAERKLHEDRIEALTKERAVMDNTVADLEAKLAKAVEALEFYTGYDDGPIARATLAEIRGESHE